MWSRRILLGSIAAPAVVLAAVSLAWACVPQATFGLSPNQGAAGSQATASGSGFETGKTVEIRWESRTGPVLATATGPSFNNVPITIPASATPGVHVISAADLGPMGDHSATAAPFEVAGASPPPPGPQPPPPGTQPPPPATQPPPGGQQPPPTATPPRDDSARAKAIATCKRKYSAKRARTPAKKRRLAKKRRACLRRASNSAATQATTFESTLPAPFG